MPVAPAFPKQRTAPRRKAFQPASVRTGAMAARFHLLNISSGGALCHMARPPAPGAELVVDFQVWRIDARVVWVEGRRFGIAFARQISARLVSAVLQDWELRVA